MANKLVIITKGQTAGVEYPLDAHTGTDLRDICYEGGGQFWITRDPNLIHHYRLDASGAALRHLASDAVTIAGGTTTDLYGIATDGHKLYYAAHNFRAGTHNNQLIMFSKAGLTVQSINQDTNAVDNTNRLKGMDAIGDRILYLYQPLAANTVLRVLRMHSGTPVTINQIDLGASGFVGACFDLHGGGFWVLNSSGVLSNLDSNGALLEQFTITASGTVRGICDMRKNSLAIAMT